MKQPYLIKDENKFTSTNKNNQTITLSECIERRLLISPDSKKVLRQIKHDTKIVLSDNQFEYLIEGNCPVLYPKEISDNWQNGVLPLKYPETPLQQYILLSQIKQSGEINAPLNSEPARKHQWRFKEFCQDIQGLVLDVGSDRPSHSIQLLPEKCKYIGLDPYAGQGEFRLIGLGEILPVADDSVDVVIFNTSLDHILDFHTAIDEAQRVLKPKGSIVIATYAWLENATLLTDSVHFHHFREREILGALSESFKTVNIKRYEDPKLATHRYGLYVMANKL